MTNFEDLLTRSENAPRKHVDVEVCLDAELVEQRDALLDLLKTAKAEADADQRLSAGEHPQVTALRERLDALTEAARDSMVTLRFYRMPGSEWNELTSHHPVRADVPIDRHYGYNIDTLGLAAAAHVDDSTGQAYGFRVEGDEEVTLTPEQWVRLFRTLSGPEVSGIVDTIWAMNEAEPARRLDALVKGFGAARRSETK
jgi:hypothetical protein